ncbi:protein CFT1-like [Vicia villosa]|uniref:protein CFT1-like n=1 Tax=Vicia villosa TaxID=3911 RepID=UPI00273C4B34|nr:protein CFT1-like [Vicia villosa]
MANQRSNEAAIKNLENQVGQLANKLSEQQPGASFSANTQINPKEHCKAIVTRSGRTVNNGVNEEVIVEDEEEIIIEDEEEEVTVKNEGEKSEEKIEEELVEKERKEKEEREKNDKKVKKNKKRNENKKKYTDEETVVLDAHCSAIIQKTLPRKEADPGRVILPITIGGNYISNGLVDLGSSINLIPLSVVKRLGNIEMKHTGITLQLADKSIISPYGVVQDMLVKVDKFLFPVDFVVVEMEEDRYVPLILGRPFMKTTRMMIDIDDGIMKVRVQDKEVIFTLFESMKPHKDEHDNFQIDDEKGEIIKVANQIHKDKANHEGKTYHKNFEVGQMVLVCNSRHKVFPSKLKSKWSGPFVVKEVRNYGVIKVEDPKTQESWTVKERRLKVYHDE